MQLTSTIGLIYRYATQKGKKAEDILTREEIYSLYRGNPLTPETAKKIEEAIPELTANFLISYDSEYFKFAKEFEYIKKHQKCNHLESQPIYAIVRYWCGCFDGIEVYSTEGDKDLNEMRKIYNEKYKWKPGQIGITEQCFKLVELTFNVVEQDDF